MVTELEPTGGDIPPRCHHRRCCRCLAQAQPTLPSHSLAQFTRPLSHRGRQGRDRESAHKPGCTGRLFGCRLPKLFLSRLIPLFPSLSCGCCGGWVGNTPLSCFENQRGASAPFKFVFWFCCQGQLFSQLKSLVKSHTSYSKHRSLIRSFVDYSFPNISGFDY